MNRCQEQTARAEMSDDEFWDHVLNHGSDSDSGDDESQPDEHLFTCARCGSWQLIDDDDDDTESAFCDNCVDECAPDEEATW